MSLILARWYAIPCGLCVLRARSGCPSGIPGVSFGCACARAIAASAPPLLPGLVWRAHLARSRCWALVGPFHSVRAPPRVLSRSLAPFGLLGRGAARSRFPPTWLGAVRSPLVGSARLGRSNAGGWGWGGGRPARRPPRWRGGEGKWGGGLSYLGPSRCLPWTGNNAGVFGVALAMEGVTPILRFVLACCLRARSVWRPCALARVRLSIVVPAGAGGWGRGGGSCCVRPPASRVPQSFREEAGTIPSASGGLGGRRPRGPRVGGGEWEGRVGGRAVVLHLPPLTPLCRWYVFRRGRGVSPGAVRGLPPAGQPRGGGGKGGRCAALPGGVAGGLSGAGGRSASVRPSAFCGRATKQVSLAMLWPWRAWLAYCSGSCLRAAPGRGPCVVLVRWPVAAPAGSGVGGRAGARCAGSAASAPGAAAPSGGGGTSPLPRGGWRAGAPVACRPEGRSGGRGEGGSRRGSPPPCPGGWPVAPGPVSLLCRRTPPGYICSAGVAGQPRAPGVAWPAVGWSALGKGGGGCHCAVPPGARPEGPAGRRAGRSPCRGLFPCLLRAGTKAGRFVSAPPSMLHSWA